MLATSNISTGTEGQAWMKPPITSVSQIPGNEPGTSQAGATPVVDGKVQHNPVLNFDRDAQVVLVQIVDPATGEVERQYPSEKQIEAYQKAVEEQQDALPDVEAPDIPAGLEDNTSALPEVSALGQSKDARPSMEVSLVA